MVLGNVGDAPVCYYCNKPGHVKKDCFKLKNDLASRGNGRGMAGNDRGMYGQNRGNGGRF
jgi:hypothetical protein